MLFWPYWDRTPWERRSKHLDVAIAPPAPLQAGTPTLRVETNAPETGESAYEEGLALVLHAAQATDYLLGAEVVTATEL